MLTKSHSFTYGFHPLLLSRPYIAATLVLALVVHVQIPTECWRFLVWYPYQQKMSHISTDVYQDNVRRLYSLFFEHDVMLHQTIPGHSLKKWSAWNTIKQRKRKPKMIATSPPGLSHKCPSCEHFMVSCWQYTFILGCQHSDCVIIITYSSFTYKLCHIYVR